MVLVLTHLLAVAAGAVAYRLYSAKVIDELRYLAGDAKRAEEAAKAQLAKWKI